MLKNSCTQREIYFPIKPHIKLFTKSPQGRKNTQKNKDEYQVEWIRLGSGLIYYNV